MSSDLNGARPGGTTGSEALIASVPSAEPATAAGPKGMAGLAGRWWAISETLTAYSFLAPTIAFFAVFMFLPIGLGFWLSLENSSGFGVSTFVGLANYRAMIHDPIFWKTLGNTAIYTILTVPSSVLIGLAIALLLKDEFLRGRNIYRSFVYFPMVISGVATAIVGGWMFNENLGVADKFLAAVHLPTIHWQSSSFPAMMSLVVMTLWTRVGFNMVIYLAGLQNMDSSYLEAAAVDGAGPWRRFRRVTWPMLGPTTFFLVVMNVIYSFQVFDLVYVMTGGGPSNSTNMLGVYAYQQGFIENQQGYATAIGMALFVLVLAFTAIQWRVSRHRDLA
ncbi:MAG TPA: sugar ABC transporter permease [Streptosporangiaceae bacterium]|nr:sugar ABC transporter permease [Streptosporangiaceae bacterium]